MSQVSIKRLPRQSLGEIYQSMGLQMAILEPSKDGYKQLTTTVQCRDFLCDVFSSSFEKTSFSIYGMSWDGVDKSPPTDTVCLLLKFPKAEAKESFLKNSEYLFKIEGDNKYTQTKTYETDQKLELVVVGDKKWITNALSFSLYTFLLRVFCYPIKTKDWITEIGDQKYTDSRYIKSIHRETWDRILSDLSILKTKTFCGLSFKEHGVHAVHHNSGFVSVFGRHSEISPSTVKLNQHYIEMKQLGLKMAN